MHMVEQPAASDLGDPSLQPDVWFDLPVFDTGHYVYVLWGDDKSRPLYIGQTTRLLTRMGEHLNKPWKRSEVRRITAIRCATVEDMCRREIALIRNYRPTWNVAHNMDEHGLPALAPMVPSTADNAVTAFEEAVLPAMADPPPAEPVEVDRLWTTDEVGYMIGHSGGSILGGMKRGIIPHVRDGRLWRMANSQLEGWMASSSSNSAEAAEVAARLNRPFESVAS